MDIKDPTFSITGDMVKHPAHYQGENGIECIEAIEAALTPEEFRGYLKGCTMKYIWRENKKGNREQDIDKAVDYLGRFRAGL